MFLEKMKVLKMKTTKNSLMQTLYMHRDYLVSFNLTLIFCGTF